MSRSARVFLPPLLCFCPSGLAKQREGREGRIQKGESRGGAGGGASSRRTWAPPHSGLGETGDTSLWLSVWV